MANYEVGYKKPPLHTRFQKGVCPNPKGRKKRAPADCKDDFQEIWAVPIEVSEGGKTKLISKEEFLLKSWVQKAVQGDVKSAELIMKMHKEHFDEAQDQYDRYLAEQMRIWERYYDNLEKKKAAENSATGKTGAEDNNAK